ncbi:MAG: glycosyltransferase family 39 protein [Candidatus Bathyarchaeota archaeon]|nr:MAG: glycosyltransferase family 39 protein [Candidatus Bathyarchaeota archaeon]
MPRQRWSRTNIRIDINKRDLLSIAVLCIIFFSVAIWNLGLTQVPTTNWQANENKTFYIDLGKPESVGTVYFLVKNGSANVQVYTGSPGNWSNSKSFAIPTSYYSWNEVNINSGTQYVRFDFEQASIEVAEMALLSQDNQRIVITAINSENTSDPNLSELIDEQSLVQCPPNYMSETVFDEIYFVRTAENYLQLQHPYEWTHPPLGKLIIASGISVFGYNPFGWRIMGVVFATLMIPVIYILGKKLFGTWIGAFASAFLLTFDFMHFTMARMATVDTYVVLFSLASQLFFLIYLKDVLKNGWKAPVQPLFLAILFFALGFSTKWFVLYGFAGQLAILAVLRLKEVAKLKKNLSDKINAFFDHPYSMVVGFLLVAVLVYFLTYIPDILAGRSVLDVLGLQGGMFNYHATLTATHPYSSPWWTWPFMLKPVWLYVSYLPLSVKSTIVLLGNPAVWWAGFAFIILAVERAVRKRVFAGIFIAAFFFFQWLPYALISRVTFLYHFYVSVPFLCLASAYFLSKYWSTKWGKVVAVAYFASVVVLFGLFYLVISGTPASTSWIDSLKWLSGWGF